MNSDRLCLRDASGDGGWNRVSRFRLRVCSGERLKHFDRRAAWIGLAKPRLQVFARADGHRCVCGRVHPRAVSERLEPRGAIVERNRPTCACLMEVTPGCTVADDYRATGGERFEEHVAEIFAFGGKHEEIVRGKDSGYAFARHGAVICDADMARKRREPRWHSSQ